MIPNDFILPFKALVKFCVFVSLLLLVFPKGKFEKAIKTVSGLCVVLLIVSAVSPILGAVISADIPDDAFSNGERYAESVTETTGIRIAGLVKEAITGRFGIPEGAVSVSVTVICENGEGTVKEAAVFIPENYSEKFTSVAEYVSDLLGAPCTVISD